MRKTRDVLSVEWIRLELVRAAYATRGGVLAAMDPRAVLAWYALLALAPWFTHNVTVLTALFLLGLAAVLLARVGPLLLGLFLFGIAMETIYLAAAAWLFGGDLSTVVALAVLSLKLGTVSAASMAAFVSLDPEKLSDGLLALRAPELVAFGVSYGYRMLPVLIDEYGTVLESSRLRTAPPAKPGFLGYRVLWHHARLVVLAFYPMFLNTALAVRTTVESLETRGFTFAMRDGGARRLRLAHLRFGPRDGVVLALTVVGVAAAFGAGQVWPVYRM
ncbi:energy-coupling factor transporter transmembrane component T family protein [Ruania halotolerans]|uniref:energy-coupling factor transporter transmembrane component T family protein n=1 Tax=Ruania halotolerans TaxID=2897773 RepID=UPI001E5637B1|nr:energy-coupling factor transporter transmembrane component T [Ruania halotolerans]UFU08040.1 energy-coupling factor transporter transmembrane protein EcfT [Ruania halotolerans]